jgi:hypothetical protein
MKLNLKPKLIYTYVITGVLLISLIVNVILAYHSLNRTRVVKVDTGYLIQNLVKEVATKNLNEEELRLYTKNQLVRLDQLLEQIAKQENLVLLTSKAVVTGAVDITKQIELIMRQQDEGSN